MATTSRQARSDASSATAVPSAPVRVDVSTTGTHLLLAVSGEVDLATAPALRDALGAALTRRPSSVTLDVSGLTYCDLAGLDVLDDFCAAAARIGVAPVVHGMSRRLAWLHARFPAPNGLPVAADRPAAPVRLPSQAERRWPDGGRPLASRAGTTHSPRAWPER